MASSDILSQTLSSITSIKLDEISYHRSSFETAKIELLETVQNTEDQGLKVKALLELKDGTLPGKFSLPAKYPLLSCPGAFTAYPSPILPRHS